MRQMAWTEGEALMVLCAAREGLGYAPTMSEWRENYGAPSDTTIRRLFGSWDAAWRAVEEDLRG